MPLPADQVILGRKMHGPPINKLLQYNPFHHLYFWSVSPGAVSFVRYFPGGLRIPSSLGYLDLQKHSLHLFSFEILSKLKYESNGGALCES